MAMTEIDFSRDQCPDVRRFQLDASNTKATQVNVPHWAKKVTIRPETVNGVRFIKLSGNTPSEFTFWDGYKASNGITKIYISNLSSYSTAIQISVMVEGNQ